MNDIFEDRSQNAWMNPEYSGFNLMIMQSRLIAAVVALPRNDGPDLSSLRALRSNLLLRAYRGLFLQNSL